MIGWRRMIEVVNSESFSRLRRWAVIGVITVAGQVLLFRLFYGISGSVLLANAIASPTTVSFNYFMHHRWSFRATRSHRGATPRFAAFMGSDYLLNSLLVTLLITVGLSAGWAKLAAVPIQAPWNFLILNRWVFHGNEPIDPPEASPVPAV